MKFFALLFFAFQFSWIPVPADKLPVEKNKDKVENESSQKNYITDLYEKCELEGKLDFDIFSMAITGYSNITTQNNKILSIADLTKPSNKKRLFIIDLEKEKILYRTFVAHGKNSGMVVPTQFSNKIGSLKSSLGFYLTGNTYIGKHGYSLLLNGIEKGINDNARVRGIVIHGANYVSKKYIERNNRIGRSWGCPAVSEELSRQIIDTIKGGSCLFIYSDDVNYQKKSAFANLPQLNIHQLAYNKFPSDLNN
jgi:L,D-transpeptidase catalytic domain